MPWSPNKISLSLKAERIFLTRRERRCRGSKIAFKMVLICFSQVRFTDISSAIFFVLWCVQRRIFKTIINWSVSNNIKLSSIKFKNLFKLYLQYNHFQDFKKLTVFCLPLYLYFQCEKNFIRTINIFIKYVYRSLFFFFFHKWHRRHHTHT